MARNCFGPSERKHSALFGGTFPRLGVSNNLNPVPPLRASSVEFSVAVLFVGFWASGAVGCQVQGGSTGLPCRSRRALQQLREVKRAEHPHLHSTGNVGVGRITDPIFGHSCQRQSWIRNARRRREDVVRIPAEACDRGQVGVLGNRRQSLLEVSQVTSDSTRTALQQPHPSPTSSQRLRYTVG